MSAEAWSELAAELDRWSAQGMAATLWWRDDDATEPTPQLDRLLALANRWRTPIGLAVIPLNATPALTDRLRAELMIDVLQHGYSHRNHARAGGRAAEFGGERPLAERLAEVSNGWQLLSRFERRQPMFVPPWNRYDPTIADGIGAIGIAAISAFGDARRLPAGLIECNCHVDIISWRTTRGFAGTEKTVGKLVEHLASRRLGNVERHAATGLLTHHLVHDAGCWEFLGQLLDRLSRHPATKWVRPMEAAAAGS